MDATLIGIYILDTGVAKNDISYIFNKIYLIGNDWDKTVHGHALKLCTGKVVLFVVTNLCGLYKMHWSMGSWIQWENCISLDFYFRGLSEPRNPRKLEPHDQ